MAGEGRPDGWELPVAQALAEPVMLAGMPREYAILVGTVAVVLGLAGVAGVVAGGFLAESLPEDLLERLFGVLVLGVAAQLAWRSSRRTT